MLAAATVVGVTASIAAPPALAYDFHVTSGVPAAFIARVSATATVTTGLSGIGRSQPRLHFDIRATRGVPITTVTVAAPSGLYFSRHAADLRRGVHVTGATKAQRSVRRGLLVVTLTGAKSHVQLTITGPALTEGRFLVAKIVTVVQYNQTHTANPQTLLLKMKVTVKSGTAISIGVPVTFTFH